jgi:hypothetical protein
LAPFSLLLSRGYAAGCELLAQVARFKKRMVRQTAVTLDLVGKPSGHWH